jgi:hypothetical protein
MIHILLTMVLLKLGSQVLASTPGLFLRQGLTNLLPRMALTSILQISASQVAGITGLSHCTELFINIFISKILHI